MSSELSWRERTSAICERSAKASLSRGLGISISKLAPASPSAPASTEDDMTMPS